MNHVHEVAKVIALFDITLKGKENGVFPMKINWKNREYKVSELNLHYTRLIDGAINHIFNIVAGGAVMELHFNTKTLVWTVEQIQDTETPA
jgi:hypothetical protein